MCTFISVLIIAATKFDVLLRINKHQTGPDTMSLLDGLSVMKGEPSTRARRPPNEVHVQLGEKKRNPQKKPSTKNDAPTIAIHSSIMTYVALFLCIGLLYTASVTFDMIYCVFSLVFAGIAGVMLKCPYAISHKACFLLLVQIGIASCLYWQNFLVAMGCAAFYFLFSISEFKNVGFLEGSLFTVMIWSACFHFVPPDASVCYTYHWTNVLCAAVKYPGYDVNRTKYVQSWITLTTDLPKEANHTSIVCDTLQSANDVIRCSTDSMNILKTRLNNQQTIVDKMKSVPEMAFTSGQRAFLNDKTSVSTEVMLTTVLVRAATVANADVKEASNPVNTSLHACVKKLKMNTEQRDLKAPMKCYDAYFEAYLRSAHQIITAAASKLVAICWEYCNADMVKKHSKLVAKAAKHRAARATELKTATKQLDETIAKEKDWEFGRALADQIGLGHMFTETKKHANTAILDAYKLMRTPGRVHQPELQALVRGIVAFDGKRDCDAKGSGVMENAVTRLNATRHFPLGLIYCKLFREVQRNVTNTTLTTTIKYLGQIEDLASNMATQHLQMTLVHGQDNAPTQRPASNAKQILDQTEDAQKKRLKRVYRKAYRAQKRKSNAICNSEPIQEVARAMAVSATK